METLIDDLLDLAAGKANGPDDAVCGPVSLNELLHDVCVRYELLIGEKDLSIQHSGLDDELMVYGDRDELDRIFNNLISNAVKYTQKGRVEVRAQREDGWARITVADTGIGIPADALPQLFQEFFRARNAKASQEPGTGLGLAIVKNSVERCGGRIEVESVEGKGTTFVVLLPVQNEGKSF